MYLIRVSALSTRTVLKVHTQGTWAGKADGLKQCVCRAHRSADLILEQMKAKNVHYYIVPGPSSPGDMKNREGASGRGGGSFVPFQVRIASYFFFLFSTI